MQRNGEASFRLFTQRLGQAQLWTLRGRGGQLHQQLLRYDAQHGRLLMLVVGDFLGLFMDFFCFEKVSCAPTRSLAISMSMSMCRFILRITRTHPQCVRCSSTTDCRQGPRDCSRRADQQWQRPYVLSRCPVVRAVDFTQRNGDVSGWTVGRSCVHLIFLLTTASLSRPSQTTALGSATEP